MRYLAFAVLTLVAALSGRGVAAAEPAGLPKIVLIGDSIRLGYSPTVVKQLEGKAVVTGPTANGGDSNNVVRHLAEWAVAEKPDVVHFNCGIHDTKKDKQTGKFQVPPEQYEANLRTIVDTIRKETKAVVIFATTTPIIDDRAAKVRVDRTYELLDASIVQYNTIALRVMKELNVPVDDLRAVVGEGETRGKLMSDDGTHFTTAGRTQLGNAVAEFVSKHLPGKQ